MHARDPRFVESQREQRTSPELVTRPRHGVELQALHDAAQERGTPRLVVLGVNQQEEPGTARDFAEFGELYRHDGVTAADLGLPPEAVRPTTPSLEDVFVTLAKAQKAA